jgi:NitT/TauT family transport system substrate-binding protein
MRRSIFLGGLGSALLASSCKSEMPEFRIALNPWPGYMFLDLAQRRGFFAAEGLKVKTVLVSSLSDVVQTYQRGQSDIIASSLIEPLIISEQTARPLRIFRVADSSSGADFLMARPGINSVADLKGKRIAAEPNSNDMITLHYGLKSAGLKISDVQHIPLVQQSALEPENAITLDAIQTYPPFTSDWEKRFGFKKIYDSSSYPGIILDVLSIDRALDRQYPDLSAQVSRAYNAALLWFMANRKEGAELMLATVKAADPSSSASAADYGMEGLKIYDDADQAAFFSGGGLAKSIAEYDEIMLETKMLRRIIDPSEVI